MNILIVDDDPAYQILTRSFLAEYGRCDIASDGLEAISIFQKALDKNDPYHLIILDIVMPNMDGRETLDAIRKIEKDHGITNTSDTAAKVIIATSMDDTDNFLKSLEFNCQTYIIKPFTPDELIEKVETCCQVATK